MQDTLYCMFVAINAAKIRILHGNQALKRQVVTLIVQLSHAGGILPAIAPRADLMGSPCKECLP